MECDKPLCVSALRTMMIHLQPCDEPPIVPGPVLLEKLKCKNCGWYLASPPVYETDSGDTICGSCPAPKGDTARRAKLYETLAEMVSFPCKYTTYGCFEVVKFLDQKKHDGICEFKPIICPIATDGSCEWTGPKGQIYNHCDLIHVSRILHNTSPPMKINPGKTMFNAYVMQALGKLYLLHIKICIVKRKIYYSMRYVGKKYPDCMFRVELHTCTDKISKMGKVLPEEELQFNEDNCMAVGFTSLLDVLGPQEDIYSKVSIYNKCAECHEHFKKLVFHADYGWICMDCVPPVSSALLKHLSKPISKKELKARHKALTR